MENASSLTGQVLDGSVRGRIALPSSVALGARGESLKYFSQCEEEAFSRHQVEDLVFPDWAADRWDFFPMQAVLALGYGPRKRKLPAMREALYVTAGCDTHADDMNGPNFLLCLHNGGLMFHMGAVKHQTQAGEWFLFDDREDHGVDSTFESTAYMVWSVPLVKI